MKPKHLFLILVILFLTGGGIFIIDKNKQKEIQQININNNTQTTTNNMKLTSNAFGDNQPIPAKYTCDGENINPPLTISDVPANAKSLVLIVDDPDAPLGVWTHWTVWNIDSKTTEIAPNSIPVKTIEGKTSFGKPGYGGPCPPSGSHHYFFKLYALDTTLSIANSSTKQDLENAMTGHIIGKTELVGLYSRK